MRVYFNNNSFTWGEALKDSFSRTVSGCSCGTSTEQSPAQAQSPTQAQLCSWGRHWHCPVTTSQATSCYHIPATLQHLVSASGSWCHRLSFFLFSLTNYRLGPGLLATISPCVQRFSLQLHVSVWDSKLTQHPTAFRALIEFGPPSYFQYLTQSITPEPQS